MRVGVARVERHGAAEAVLGQAGSRPGACRSGRAGCRRRDRSGRWRSTCLSLVERDRRSGPARSSRRPARADARAPAVLGLVGRGHRSSRRPATAGFAPLRLAQPPSTHRGGQQPAHGRPSPAAPDQPPRRACHAHWSPWCRRSDGHRFQHHGALLGDALGRTRVRSFTSPASWPQAASMSSPRVLRTVVTIPASLSIFAKASTRVLRRTQQARRRGTD